MNTKTEIFWHKNRKTDLKNSQNRKTENPNAPLVKEPTLCSKRVGYTMFWPYRVPKACIFHCPQQFLTAGQAV